MLMVIFFSVFLNHAQALECLTLLSPQEPSSNLVNLSTVRNQSRITTDFKDLSERLIEFNRSWENRWLYDEDQMSEEEKVKALALIKELFSFPFVEDHLNADALEMYEAMAQSILLKARDVFYLSGSDISSLKNFRWPEFIIFFELRRIKSPLDKALITRQLNMGLKIFFASKGGANNPSYIELSEQIRTFDPSFN